MSSDKKPKKPSTTVTKTSQVVPIDAAQQTDNRDTPADADAASLEAGQSLKKTKSRAEMDQAREAQREKDAREAAAHAKVRINKGRRLGLGLV